MNLARISPTEFLPQMASKPSIVHESWSLKVRPDHVLSHTEAQGKMNNKATLQELCVLGLCSSAIRFKTESLRSKPFSWEASGASSCLMVSVIIHFWCANWQTNTGRNYQIHSDHHYQNGGYCPKLYCFPHKQPKKQQVGLCLSSQQSKPPEGSVDQRQCNTVTLTKAFMSSGLFFTVISSPLFQALESTSLFLLMKWKRTAGRIMKGPTADKNPAVSGLTKNRNSKNKSSVQPGQTA